jgi:hypothetical protein
MGHSSAGGVLSLTHSTSGVSSQLSVAAGGTGSGTSSPQPAVIEAGHSTTGGVVSLTVIVWVHVAVFPQSSVAV